MFNHIGLVHKRIIGAPIFKVNRYADTNPWHDFKVKPKNLSSLGGRLFAARKLRKMTQASLAQHSGVKQPSISELETGESLIIAGDTLVGVCEALHIRPSWLLHGRGSPDSRDEHLPAEAIEVAKNWLKLDTEMRQSIAATLRAATKHLTDPAPPKRPTKTK